MAFLTDFLYRPNNEIVEVGRRPLSAWNRYSRPKRGTDGRVK